MTNLKHVYMTAHGTYLAGAWVGEGAQIGLRFSYEPVIAAPLKGDIYVPQTGGSIDADFGSLAGTHGTLAKTWKARIGDTGSLENVDAAAQVDLAEDMWKFLNVLKAYQGTEFKWTHVKVAAVDTAGAIPRVASVYTFTTPLAGTTGSGALPPQVALALSTRANLVGRRGRGRVYIPALSQGMLASDGTVNTTNAGIMRNAFKTLIDDVQAAPGLTVNQPIVFVGSHDSTDVVRPVELRTGNRLDTIQSRRRQVAETYTTLAL